jgi:hypothetical protein
MDTKVVGATQIFERLNKIGTLNPHPFTDLLKLSNLEWAKCLGRMTVVKRYLSYDESLICRVKKMGGGMSFVDSARHGL